MDNDVSAMLEGTDEIGSGEGIVDHQRNGMPMRDFRNTGDIHQIRVGIADAFYEHRFGIGLNRLFVPFIVIATYECGVDSQLGEGMGNRL